ncbi:MAG: hypothetical protein MSC31_08130 [Solirubrobacteraceae bacterium MAG38_C4-C5]|nr:hypothetical protein [Candidatus Siliceabacter maunaloa]
MRRRIRIGRSPAAVAGQVVAGLLALVVAWYAAMLVLLALKAPAGLVDVLTRQTASSSTSPCGAPTPPPRPCAT